MEEINSQYVTDIIVSPIQSVEVKKHLDEEKKRLNFIEYKIKDAINFNFEVRFNREIVFERCIFFNKVFFWSQFTTKNKIHFINCEFHETIHVMNGDVSDLIFEECKIAMSLIFKGGKFGRIIINRGVINEISILKGTFEKLQIGSFNFETEIRTLFLNFSELKGLTNIYKAKIIELDIRGQIAAGVAVEVIECCVRHFIIAEVINNGRLLISKLFTTNSLKWNFNLVPKKASHDTVDEEQLNQFYLGSIFSIYNSVLNKAEFNLIDLKNIDKVFILDSNIGEVIFTNITWPRKVYNYLPPNFPDFEFLFFKKGNNSAIISAFPTKQKQYIYKGVRETFRQFKNAVVKQNDFVSEQYFHGLEMNAYNMTLSWGKNFWVKLILKFSYWTSNYGQSFLLPIIWIIGLNGFLFWLLYLSEGTRFNSYNLYYWSNYFDTIGEFLRIVNPLHKNEPELRGISLCLDILIRILSSYFIYNIIRATRRFIR